MKTSMRAKLIRIDLTKREAVMGTRPVKGHIEITAEKRLQALRLSLYRLADELQQTVYLITQAKSSLESTSITVPYGVIEEQADEWEKHNAFEIISP